MPPSNPPQLPHLTLSLSVFLSLPPPQNPNPRNLSSLAMAKKQELAPKPVEEEEEEEEVEEEEESGEEEDDEEESDADESSSLSRESIHKLLEPFGKDQLIDLLKQAALKDPSLLARIAGTPAPADPSLRKIFVHGLGWDATTDLLTAAFSPFGQIEDCRAVADRTTGRCKGFGFVLFRTVSAARRALKEPQKKIGNRMASCQLASLGPPTPAAAAQRPPAFNPALLGQTLNLGLLGQGLNNPPPPALGGYGAAAPAGLSRNYGDPSPYGVGSGLGGGVSGVNSISPSVIGRYGSPSALQDLGTNPYSSAAGTRSQLGYGSSGSGYPSYLGRY